MKLKTACKCTLLTVFLIPLLILRGRRCVLSLLEDIENDFKINH